MPTTGAGLLVVGDEPNVRELLSASLRFAGFQVTVAASGAEATEAVAREHPDLVVLDAMLPDLDGFTAVRGMRRRAGAQSAGPQSSRTPSPIPVIFLIAGRNTDGRIGDLGYSVDDYLTKPFSLEELVSRIRTILRRTGPPASDDAPLVVADLELDPVGRQALRAGLQASLSPTEFRLLEYLMRNSGRVMSKAQILKHVWAYDFDGDLSIVESYISYLRRKIDPGTGDSPKLIHTLRGIGYVLRPPAA
jgi:two-component system, OmpR family, response regulator